MFRWIKNLFETRPPTPAPKLQHQRLGLLSGEEGLWRGVLQRDGRDIPFVVAGTEVEPDPHLVDRLLALIPKLRDIEENALNFLCTPDACVAPDKFEFTSIDLLSAKEPQNFTLEFAMEGDTGAIWRVEFEGNQPKYSGRDD